MSKNTKEKESSQMQTTSDLNSGLVVFIADQYRYRVVSANGSLLGGYDSSQGANKATVWSVDRSEQWTLSPFDISNPGSSEITAISASGGTFAGKALVSGRQHAVIWNSVQSRPIDLEASSPANTIDSTVTVVRRCAGGFITRRFLMKSFDCATLWTDDGRWQDQVTLGTFRSGDVGNSRVMSLTSDSSIAGGFAELETGKLRAAIWHGHGWKEKVKLGTLPDDNNGVSQVNALSDDGTIAAGGAILINPYEEHALIWHGDQWSNEIRLGTLLPDNSGSSFVYALSADGKIAAGKATVDTKVDPETEIAYFHATIWSGENWATKTDLGTLRQDNSGNSVIYSLTADGTIAVGSADADDGNRHSVVWQKISDGSWIIMFGGDLP